LSPLTLIVAGSGLVECWDCGV